MSLAAYSTGDARNSQELIFVARAQKHGTGRVTVVLAAHSSTAQRQDSSLRLSSVCTANSPILINAFKIIGLRGPPTVQQWSTPRTLY